jgi:hypothetical protein
LDQRGNSDVTTTLQHRIRIFGDGNHMTGWPFLCSNVVLLARGWEGMRSLELADIALGAAAIIVMLALLLVSMPGWH